MINPLITIANQYANSPILDTIITNWNSCFDPSVNIDNFYDQIWNINTAQGYGLDLWGRIIGVNRYMFLPNVAQYFGFHEAMSWVTWGNAPFWSGQPLTNPQPLTDTEYRALLLAKAFSNTCNCSIGAINVIIHILFGNNCYILDNEDMTMTIVFESALTVRQLATLLQSDVIPRPAGILSYTINGLGNPPQLIVPIQVLQ